MSKTITVSSHFSIKIEFIVKKLKRVTDCQLLTAESYITIILICISHEK